MNELRGGLSQQLVIVVEFFHNERGKTGELVDGPFATMVVFSKMSPESALDRKNSSVGRYCPRGTRFIVRILLVIVTPIKTE